MNAIKRVIIKVMSKKSKPMMWYTCGVIGDVCKAFYKKNRNEALPVIVEVANKSGVEWAEILREMAPVKSMRDLDELFKMMDMTMDTGIEIIEASDDVFHFKMPKCIYGIQGTSRELCEAMMVSDKTMISTLLGKEVDVKIPQTMAESDNICEVIFSIK